MKVTKIEDAIYSATSNQLLELNNRYCDVFNYGDSEIFINDDEFFNVYFEGKPMDAVRAAHFGNYQYHHEHVKFDGYGNLESLSEISTDDLPDSVGNMADNIAERWEEFSDLDCFTDIDETDYEDEETED